MPSGKYLSQNIYHNVYTGTLLPQILMLLYCDYDWGDIKWNMWSLWSKDPVMVFKGWMLIWIDGHMYISPCFSQDQICVWVVLDGGLCYDMYHNAP